MSLIGIVAKKKDIQLIKKEIDTNKIELIEITKESIENLKNIKFDEIILVEDIKGETNTYKYMSELISKVKYLIINADIEIQPLKEIEIKNPVKVITFGFNPKATITISSVKEDKIILGIQRNIEKNNKTIIEPQERVIEIENKKIYNKIVVFIMEELHN